MKRGEVIRGYRVVSEPTNAGAGRCVWAFAEKSGEQFHLKEFLEPKYPLESQPGSAKAKARRRTHCEAFEGRHRRIMEQTKAVTSGGGNLIAARDFFRDGSIYYKVTERVDFAAAHDPTRLNDRQRSVLLRTLTNSVGILHRNGIVHGDLKPDNVLLRVTDADLITTKLIDFDDSYFVGDPPPPGEIVGDPSHYSPELLAYIKADPEDADPSSLSPASDIFALGLVFHWLLSGRTPGAKAGERYACEIVSSGEPLPIAKTLTAEHATLVREMVAADANARPTIGDVKKVLFGGGAESSVPPVRIALPPIATTPADGKPRVRAPSFKPGPDDKSGGAVPAPATADDATSTGSRVRANFGKRTTT